MTPITIIITIICMISAVSKPATKPVPEIKSKTVIEKEIVVPKQETPEDRML